MRIRHLIPTAGPGISEDLDRAQPVTFASIDRAVRLADPSLDIDVCAVRFADEAIPASYPWLRDLPVLQRSILDLGAFRHPRRLPLMGDVLAAFGDPSDFDLAVLTNADIGVQPLFYELIADLVDRGHDAASITRRTVHPRFGRSTLAHYSSALGSPHPGHDCLIMKPALIPNFVGDVALGVRFVARPILWHLMLSAQNFQVFSDLHATFHIGDEMQWTDPRFSDLDRHNLVEVQRVVEHLVVQHGAAAVDRLRGVWVFRKASAQGRQVQLDAQQRLNVQADAMPSRSWSQRMIFLANSSKPGTELMSRFLDASPVISCRDKQTPETAVWLRSVADQGFEATLASRRSKAQAIRAELKELSPWSIYADTGEMFVETFADVVLDEFEHHTISIVDLCCDPIDVARDYFALDYFDPTSFGETNPLLSPTAPFATFRLRPEQVQSRFDLIFGYLIGIAARTRHLREMSPRANWVEVQVTDLATGAGAQRLFERLEVELPGDLSEVVEEQVDAFGAWKASFDRLVPAEEALAHWHSFFERFRGDSEVVAFAARHGLDTP